MSADNWAMCPRCKDRRREAADEARAKVTAAYGVVTVEAFDQLRAEADRLAGLIEGERHGETFREDYEIGGAADGEVYVSYRGNCQKCGLTLKFEHTHPLDVTG